MITGGTDAVLTDAPIGLGTTNPQSKIGGGFTVESPSGEYLCLSSLDQAAKLWGRDDGCQPAPGVVLMLYNFTTSHLGHLYTGGRWRVLLPIQAASIDRKVDDGRPLTGQVRGGSLDSNIHGCANDDEAYPEAETNSDVCTIGVLIEQ